MNYGKTSMSHRVYSDGLAVRRVLPLALLCLSLSLGAADCPAQAATTVKQGSTLPIYVQPQVLAEAQKPTVELVPSAGGFWMPGPELFYGYALRDLRDYLQKMTGAKYPLTAADADAKSGIFAGTFAQFPTFKPQQAEAQKAMASDDPEAFVVEAQGDRLYILGKSNFGLIAGIYGLLDKLGAKWFAPGEEWENVPQLNGLVLDNKLNVSSAGPTYKNRLFFSGYGVNSSVFNKGEREKEFVLWDLRNRNGGSAYTANLHNSPILPVELHKTQPELFALVKGKRIPEELDRDNPEAVKMATEIAIKYLKDNEGKGSFYNSFSVETGDGVPADEEGVAKFGSATDLDFWFANQVAAGIEKAGLKDKWVGMYSYSDHSSIPSFDLHPKVGVMIATGLDFSSGMTVEQRLDGFRKRKTNRLGIYHYMNWLAWTSDRPGAMPAGNPLQVAADLKRWHEHGANVIIEETSDSWINSGAGHYIASRMLWDLSRDPQKELAAYYEGAFGPAAKPVRTLYEDWVKFQARASGFARLTPAKMAQWHQWISEADQAVQGKPGYQARINDIKRYYLYLDSFRQLETDATDAKLPPKEERYRRMLSYIASNRGEGAFHAVYLFLHLMQHAPPAGMKMEPAKLGPEFQAIAANWRDEEAWKKFKPISDAEIDKMFAAAKLPLGGPELKVLPANATAPAQINFPKLHGPPAVSRNYVLKVVAPTPKLTIEVLAGKPVGGGDAARTATVMDANENDIKKVEFKIDTPFSFELNDVKPGTYTLTFPDFGAEQLTVRGGNTFGAMQATDPSWGLNPFRPAELKAGENYRAYFLIPAGQSSLRVGLTTGTIALGFKDGAVIAPEITGSAEVKKQPQEVKFAAADTPRIAYIEWKGEFLLSEGLEIEGVKLYSPDPSYVLYGSLD